MNNESLDVIDRRPALARLVISLVTEELHRQGCWHEQEIARVHTLPADEIERRQEIAGTLRDAQAAWAAAHAQWSSSRSGADAARLIDAGIALCAAIAAVCGPPRPETQGEIAVLAVAKFGAEWADKPTEKA